MKRTNQTLIQFNQNLAVVIGINQYQNGIHPLKTAKPDAVRLAGIFHNIYEYTLINPFSNSETAIIDRDATLDNLRSLLTNILPHKIKPTENDRLLFYFAGHGIAQNSETGPQGYIVPQDANLNEPKSLLPMQELHDSLAALECRHLLVILDCCFAGTFRWASTRRLIPMPQTIHWEHYHRFIRYPAWEVITSASYNQEALDLLNQDNRGIATSGQHSPFAEGLFEALEKQKADLIKDGVITAPELYLYLRDYVEKNTQEMQTPGLWPLKKHDRGEFIFKLPNIEPNLEPAPELNPDNNPYRGLKAYDEEHARFFFGRQELIQRLFTQVSRLQQQFTVVLGISGSGKSSLVKAGLLPKLRQEQLNLIEACILSWVILEELPYFPLKYLPISYAYQWQILETMRLGATPFQELIRTLKPLASNDISVEEVKDNPQNLIDEINQWSENNPQHKLLLVLDQFEELITQAPKVPSKEEEKKDNWLVDKIKSIFNSGKQKETISEFEEVQPPWEEFLDLLVKIRQKCPRLSIVVTLRSDFEPRFAESVLKPYWNRFIVRPMRPDELREVVEAPATEMALYFEPANLVDRLVDEVNQMPGALPLLSFTLSELYISLDRRWQSGETENRALTLEDYQKLGGVAGSLTRRANEEYENLPDDAHRVTMRRVMLRMVEIEGGEAVRRRVLKSELTYPSEEENKQVETVLNCLVNARLIVTGEDIESGETYYEPAHDFLVRGWDKLQNWIDEAQREGNLALQQSLTPTVKMWHDSGYKAGDLWDNNSKIETLKEVYKVNDDSENNWLNKLEAEFVKKSLKRKRNISLVITTAVTVFILGISTAAFIAELQRRNALERLVSQIAALGSYAESLLLDDKKFEALIESVRAARGLEEVKKAKNLQVSEEMGIRVMLHNLTQEGFQESNHWISHTDIVSSVDFSPDGKIIASGSWDGTVKLWYRNGNLYKTLLHSNNSDDNSTTIDRVKINPDGKIIASASWDGMVKLWTIDGSFLRTIKNQVGVRDLAFSKNNIIVTGGDDGIITIWHLDGRLLKTITGHEDYINSVAFSPDGQKFVTASDDKMIKIWNLDGHLLKTLEGHKDSVKSVSFSPDGEQIASASLDNTVKLWQSNGTLIKTLEDHQGSVWSVRFSPDGNKIASASQDNTIKIWDIDGNLIETLTVDSNTNQGFWDFAFSPDSQTIAGVYENRFNNGIITLWKNQNSSLIPLNEHKSLVVNTIFSPDNQIIATASWDNTVKLWKRDGTLIDTLEHNDSVESVSFSPDGKRIVSASQDNNIYIWNNKGDLLKKFKAHNAEIYDVTFSPDGELIASASGDHTVKLWTPDGSLVKILKRHNAAVNSVSFSPDGELIASASWDNTVKLWRRDGTLIDDLTDHYRSVLDVAFSPDGKILASASEDHTIRLWKINQNQSTTFLTSIEPDCPSSMTSPSGSGGALGISFSPDSQLIAGTCGDNNIKIWKLNGTRLITLKGHNEAEFWGVSFSSDWQTLAAGSGDNTVTVWDFTLSHLLTRSCDLVRDYLETNPGVNDNDRSLCKGI